MKYVPCVGTALWWLAFLLLTAASVASDRNARYRCEARGLKPELIHAGAWSCGPYVESFDSLGHDAVLR